MCCSRCHISNLYAEEFDLNKAGEGDIVHLSLFAFKSNPDHFIELLKEQGLHLDESNYVEEIKFLSHLCEQNGDKEGLINDTNGEPLVFDYEQIYRSVKIPKKQKELLKSTKK